MEFAVWPTWPPHPRQMRGLLTGMWLPCEPLTAQGFWSQAGHASVEGRTCEAALLTHLRQARSSALCVACARLALV